MVHRPRKATTMMVLMIVVPAVLRDVIIEEVAAGLTLLIVIEEEAHVTAADRAVHQDDTEGIVLPGVLTARNAEEAMALHQDAIIAEDLDPTIGRMMIVLRTMIAGVDLLTIDRMMIALPMMIAGADLPLLTMEEEVLLRQCVVDGVVETVREEAIFRACHCWCAMYHRPLPRQTCNEPLGASGKFGMSIFRATTTRSSPRALPLSSMRQKNKHKKHAMKWTTLSSRGGNLKWCLRKKNARLLVK